MNPFRTVDTYKYSTIRKSQKRHKKAIPRVSIWHSHALLTLKLMQNVVKKNAPNHPFTLTVFNTLLHFNFANVEKNQIKMQFVSAKNKNVVLIEMCFFSFVFFNRC